MATRVFVVLILAATLTKGEYVSITRQLECSVPMPNSNKVAVNLFFNPMKKTVSGKLVVNEGLSDVFYHAYLHKYENGQWKYNDTEIDGPLCESVQLFAKDAWKEFSPSIKPSIDDCSSIPAGLYEFKDGSVSSSNVNHFVGMTGKWILEMVLLKDDEQLSCVAVELMITDGIL